MTMAPRTLGVGPSPPRSFPRGGKPIMLYEKGRRLRASPFPFAGSPPRPLPLFCGPRVSGQVPVCTILGASFARSFSLRAGQHLLERFLFRTDFLPGTESMSIYQYEDSPQHDRPRPRFPWGVVLVPLLLLAGVAAALVWLFTPHVRNAGPRAEAVLRPVAERGPLGSDELATIEVYKKARPSVVHVTSLALRQDVFTLDVQQIPQGTGSGIVWDDAGHIITNYHVIQDGNAARVTLIDQSSYEAQVVGQYPDKDVAVLWINAPKKKLSPILIGSSHDLQVGQDAFAIGNPFGLDYTLTKGIVSALGREIESVNHHVIKDVIQTDAAINPGNSGGPLLDSAGRLVGINTAIFSPSHANGGNVGSGFAIPVDEVNRVVPQLIKTGKVVRPGLGIQPAGDHVMRQLGMQGVLVLTIKPGSPAGSAGLRPTRRNEDGQIELGDIIVAMDGKPIKSVEDLYSALDAHKIGDTVTLTILRDDRKQDVKVTLGATTSS